MDRRRIKILYIEDNPADFLLIREVLEGQMGFDYELEEAGRLADGLTLLAEEKVDAVLLDLSLPDSIGLKTFQTLKSKTHGIPIIVMTGTNDEDLAIRAVQEGAQDYLVKGRADTSMLVKAIRYAIEREKLVTQLREARDQIKTLRGLIPICASCKNIRDDKGFWHQVEEYVRDHTEAEFSHSLCSVCIKRLYPEIDMKEE